MADDQLPDRRRTGTYLFVRPKSARRPRGLSLSETPTQAPSQPSTASTEMGRERVARLRYRRPKLQAAGMDGRLAFFLSPDASVTEHYRQVAAALTADRKGPRRLWVVGAAPQAGATLTVANLGSALSELGRVTLVEAGPTRGGRTLAGLFGLASTDNPLAAGDHLDLWMLADRLALQPESGLLPISDESLRAFQAVASAADFVLIDGPPLEDAAGVEAMRQVADAAVLVIRPADLGTGRYERALDRLQGLAVAGVLVNGAIDNVLPGVS